jgi:hypothetical protein
MVGEGSFSAGKRLAYYDLDAFNWYNMIATPLEIPASLNTQLGQSSTSKGKKKKQIASAYEKNPQYPPKEYGNFVRNTVLEFYNKKILGALERTYIDHGVDGLMNLQVELNGVITNALPHLELYDYYDRDYWEHGRWLDQQIISKTSNILHKFECI